MGKDKIGTPHGREPSPLTSLLVKKHSFKGFCFTYFFFSSLIASYIYIYNILQNNMVPLPYIPQYQHPSPVRPHQWPYRVGPPDPWHSWDGRKKNTWKTGPCHELPCHLFQFYVGVTGRSANFHWWFMKFMASMSGSDQTTGCFMWHIVLRILYVDNRMHTWNHTTTTKTGEIIIILQKICCISLPFLNTFDFDISKLLFASPGASFFPAWWYSVPQKVPHGNTEQLQSILPSPPTKSAEIGERHPPLAALVIRKSGWAWMRRATLPPPRKKINLVGNFCRYMPILNAKNTENTKKPIYGWLYEIVGLLHTDLLSTLIFSSNLWWCVHNALIKSHLETLFHL